MIENIRKYSGLMIVVFVILFISFFFMDTGSRPSLGGGGTAVRIDGRAYSQQDVRRHGDNAFRLISTLAGQGDFGLYQFLSGMVGDAQTENDATLNFFTSRMLLRDAKEEFGIFPSTEDVSEYLRSMRGFAGPDGAFNPAAYRNFVDNSLGQLGMTEGDLQDLISDVLVSQRLASVVGSGLGVDRETAAGTKALERQLITAILGRMDVEAYKEGIDPTEEELKTYWELIQDSFTTPVKRKFTYFIATPEAVEEPAAEAPAVEDPAADPEAAEAARLEREKAAADATAKTAEARRAAQTKVDAAVDDFLFELEEAEAEGFETLAAAAGWEVKTTEFFAASEPPAELDVSLRSTSGGGRAVAELFSIKETSDPFSKISDALPIGENQWLVARIDGEEPSRAKTFEEAREEARTQYITEKAAEAMKAAGEKAIEAINTGLAAGKPFADAAREAGVTEIKEVESIGSFYRPEGDSEPQNLFQAASTVDPGTVAELIVESGRAFILYVAKREVVREENADVAMENDLKANANRLQMVAYDAWLRNRIENTKIEKVGF